MQSIVICEQCRQEYEPSDLLQRLCPVCLFAHALPTTPEGDPPAAEPQIGISPSGFTPPKINELAPHFPQLDIRELAGRGGMSAVYRAHHKHLDRTIALKVLPREIADTHGGTERFQREAQTLAQLNHGNIVDIYDAGQAGPWCYIVMEFVHGPNLRQLMGDNRLGSFDVLRIASDICDGLQYAHDQGVVHRDVKPENVLLGHDGQVKLADFGLAKILDPEMSVAGMTQTRQVMGTPHYLAPEQMETPTDVDNRADVYSLGVMMYEMLTGELPLGHFDPPSERIGSDPALDAIVLRAMSKDPQRRYQQARDVQHGMKTLPKVTSQPDVATRRPRWHRTLNELLLSACSIAAVFIGLLGLAREDPISLRLRQSRQQRLSNPSAQPRNVQEVNHANGEVLVRKVPREKAAEPDFGGFAARTAMILLPFCVSFILARVNVSSAGSWRDLSPLQNLCTPILLTFYLALGILALLGPGLAFLLGGWLPMWADLETWTFLGRTFGSAEQTSLRTPYWLTVYGAMALSSALWSILLAFVVSGRPQLVGRMFHPIDQRSGAALARTSAFFAAGILLPCGCILLFAAGQMGYEQSIPILK